MPSKPSFDRSATLPFPSSSPTISSASADTCSTWTSFSATSGLSTTSDRPSSDSSTQYPLFEKKVNQFGGGWITATNNLSLPELPTNLSEGIRRSRSPSLPVLPSQASTPRGFNTEDQGFFSPFGNANVAAGKSAFGLPDRGRPYPAAITYGQSDTTAPSYYEPHLTHHASVPNLSSGPRRRISGQVRFPDEIDEDDVFQPPLFGVDGRRLASKSMSALTGAVTGKNVYIASVQPSTTVEDLEREAKQFGQVLMVRIQRVGCEGPETMWHSSQRHCAFVLYETPDQATALIEYLKSRGVICDYAKEDFQTEWKSREDRQSSNLYIQGLPLDLDIKNGALESLLTPYGTVSSYKCLTDENGLRRGPVLARMEHRSQAEAAIKGLNNKPYHPNGPLLQVRIADSESQKDFKRKTNVVGDLDQFGYVRDDSRRASMPAMQSSAAIEAAALERRRQRAIEEIRALEARLQQIKVDPWIPRPSTSSSLFFPDSPPYEDVEENHYKYYRQHLDSNVSTAPSLTHTDRTLSFTSSISGYPAPLASKRIWSPPIAAPASRRVGTYNRLASIGAGLHHARSSPELTTNITNQAKLLWPERHTEGQK